MVIFSGKDVKAGVPRIHKFLIFFVFLIFINKLCGNLVSNPKLFADATSSFSVVYGITISAKYLNGDLKKIKQMGFSVENEFQLRSQQTGFRKLFFFSEFNKPYTIT